MRRTSCLSLALVMALAGAASAAPNRINLQGVLRATAGGLEDGTFTIKVDVFPDATSVTPLFTQTFTNQVVSAGLFSITLTQANMATLLTGATDPQVQISVAGAALPKQPLSSVAYALSAERATNVTGVVAVANGGTGSATQNFVDLTTTQTIAGSKNFSGNLGIGVAAPVAKLHVTGTAFNGGRILAEATQSGNSIEIKGANVAGVNDSAILSLTDGTNGALISLTGVASGVSGDLRFITGALAERMRITKTGNVGIGTMAPDLALSVAGNANKSVGGTSWATFSDARLKNVKGPFLSGVAAIMRLAPVRFEYKANNAMKLAAGVEQIGFVAQEVEKVFPEAVTTNASGYRMLNVDPILWAMLNAIKEQQAEIERLRASNADAAKLAAEVTALRAKVDENTELRARLERLETTIARLASGK